MASKLEIAREKKVLIQSFPKIRLIENLIKRICKMDIKTVQISVLGKLESMDLETHHGDSWLDLKRYCDNELKLSSNFGIISNPEIGTIFIAGFLAPLFLQEVNKKQIGEMPTAIFGILRGLGIEPNSVSSYLKTLNKNNFLLIVRGNKNELISLEDSLKK
ncbi:hypothetical protein [uncultured Winogradskyella sp.]|uniref:hypothetical protein n=1 Tax=uncultured Winogradskyella sp. TaxID=395353 RepID=UPI00260CFC96|nr:hypothetical protein [uncultured Winogradskyella sp.]